MSSIPVIGPPADLAVTPATLGGWADPTADADGRPGTRRSRQRAGRRARATGESMEGAAGGGDGVDTVPSNVGELPAVDGAAGAGAGAGVPQLRHVPGSLVPAQATTTTTTTTQATGPEASVSAVASASVQGQPHTDIGGTAPAPLVIALEATPVATGNPLLLPSPTNSPTHANVKGNAGGAGSGLVAVAPAKPAGQAPSQRGGRVGGGRAGRNVRPAQ